MNIVQLTYFKAVAEEKSVTNAAKRMFVTQSAVSQQIGVLASELNCKLFYRKGHEFCLTHDGEFVYQKIKNIIGQLEDIDKELKSRDGKVIGNIRIGSGPVASKKLLPDTISDMLEKYPDVSFSLFESHSHNIARAVADCRIDLGFGSVSDDCEFIRSETLISGRFVLICSSRSDWSSRKSVSLRELSGVNMIRRPHGIGNKRVDKVLDGCLVDDKFRLMAINTETMIPYVRRGLGMALAPDYVIDIMEPEGVSIINVEEEIKSAWGVMMDKNRPVSKAARIFIDSLKHKLGKYNRE